MEKKLGIEALVPKAAGTQGEKTTGLVRNLGSNPSTLGPYVLRSS